MAVRRKVLIAKTGLDGHWLGVTLVATALRDAGFEVVMIGMSTAAEIAAVAVDEDVQLVGLHVGGHVAIVERVIAAVREVASDIPIIAGGTIPPSAVTELEALGVRCFPPSSSLVDIVATAESMVQPTTLGPS